MSETAAPFANPSNKQHMNLGKRPGIHFQESKTLKAREANEAIQNPLSVRRVPTRVITIFPSTFFTERRTKSQAVMPFRPLRTL
jgi:hypothetical protein